jgi:para-nitrobenzyl esterase
MAPGTDIVIDTPSGRLRGLREHGVSRFRGIPYAASTAGSNRFLPPQALPAWTGTRDALAFGPRAPQDQDPSSGLPWREWIRDRSPLSEDCLVLNVYTPAHDAARRPVMFYIHGGGFNTGSGSAPGLDGSILAREGDVVVVTINHRLNLFGHCWLPQAGEPLADAGNAGMLDIVAALQWVRGHIGAFGGDAGNVTVFGQSGGASKVAVLMSMPAARGLFHKAIIQSASSLIRMATPDEAARCSHALLAELGLGEADVARLQSLPLDVLLAARKRAVAVAGDNFRPVVDGRNLPVHPFDPVAADSGREVPLLIGTCEDEQTFTLGTNPANFSLPLPQAQERLARFMGIAAETAAALMQDYATRRPGATPSDLMIAVMSDHMYRRNDILAAERKAAQAGAPVWMYFITWKSPAVGGMLKTPHTLCIPFAFGTIDTAREMLGSGAAQQALRDRMMGAWLAFARKGNPGHAGLPAWTPFDAAGRHTMVFDNSCHLVGDPLREDRLTIDRYPPYTPDASSRR